MKVLSLGALVLAAVIIPAVAEDALYLDTALRGGYEIKGQSSVTFTRTVEGVATSFSRVDIVVQKGTEFALCPIETDIDKNVSTERRCAVFE